MRPFLVDNKELGREFRDLFLNRLSEMVEQGKIQLEESGYLADLIGELRLRDWVAFIEGPPQPDCPPSVMLKYLTRYLTGGPISDRRILGERDGRIYFTARSKRKGEGPVEVSLSRVEFVRQWSLHILPKGVRSQTRASQAMPSLPRGDAMHREGGTLAGRSVHLVRFVELEDKYPQIGQILYTVQ